MSKAEVLAREIYPDWELTNNPKLYGVEQSEVRIQRAAFVEGYHQAEKDLLENEHEKSWRLDEKLWKGIKDIEEASYQYMYDASNDWAYDIPIWKDVQDAFKAGAEWKGNYELTWKDIAGILNITNVIANDDSMEERLKNMSEEEYCQEVLKRFKEIKNDTTK